MPESIWDMWIDAVRYANAHTPYVYTKALQILLTQSGDRL